MIRILFILLLCCCTSFCFGQRRFYDILKVPACWDNGKLTSITRFFLINEKGGLLLADYAENGELINVTDENVTIGYCNCNSISSEMTSIRQGGLLITIDSQPVCWDDGLGTTTDLTQIFLRNPKGHLILNYYDVSGVAITPTGSIVPGYCNCTD